MKNNQARRKFLTKIGVSTIGAYLLSFIPFGNFFKPVSGPNNNKKIKLHPDAVQREKRN